MRIFFSVGEPSGDIHAGNLIRSLRRLQPGLDCVGYGGERMQDAGCELIYPLCRHAVMGITRVLAGAATFIKLITQANRFFREHRPDAVVLVDYPGFNWWIARRARAHGIPVFYFVPPQLWAWAGWRIKKMRRNVDHVLCTLPFEKAWYKERGVEAHYVGHPFFDDLQEQRLDPVFLDQQRQLALSALGGEGLPTVPPSPLGGEGLPTVPPSPLGGEGLGVRGESPIIGLLPGSRNQEVERNWSMQYRAAARIHQARPDVRFLAACFKPHQQQWIDDYLRRHAPLPIETCVERTPEILELATACITVSGSVALELLWHAKPSTIIYRLDPISLRFCRWVLNIPHICLVNLLAGKELYPEFLTDHCESAAIAERVLTWLNDPAAYAALRQDLTALRDGVAAPGACERTARYIVSNVSFGRDRNLTRLPLPAKITNSDSLLRKRA